MWNVTHCKSTNNANKKISKGRNTMSILTNKVFFLRFADRASQYIYLSN